MTRKGRAFFITAKYLKLFAIPPVPNNYPTFRSTLIQVSPSDTRGIMTNQQARSASKELSCKVNYETIFLEKWLTHFGLVLVGGRL